ncbi:Mpp10 protein [Sporormia fimetaria CBS 119925]|uniref:Mpp10 protein n=1 Tax=Sporormia fimetaria CBS 119925 TaxID=1340428 RepID=A0A6A6UWF2_9PLEO|nr:Mpp10 protein [Sporormia fimetaria CBS 119925]
MAPPSFSPDPSISSHTLSAGSAPPMTDFQTPNSALASLLDTPTSFLRPQKTTQASILSASKEFLDHVAAAVSQTQSQRQQELRRKRKRAGDDFDVDVLHLKKVHTDGFAVSQVFEQGRKILDSTVQEIELSLPEPADEDLLSDQEGYDMDKSTSEGQSVSGSELEDGEEEYEIAEGDSSEEDMVDGEEMSDLEDEEGADEDDDIEIAEGDSADEIMEDGTGESDNEEAAEYRPDPNGLNDGFFSIDQFNKASEFLEQQDLRGEPVDEEDEEIDWDGDPFATGKSAKKSGGDDMSDDDEGGPTFGNVDLNAPEGESDDEELEDGAMDGMGDMSNANNIMYADFFAPPAKKVGKNKKKRGRPNPHNFPEKKEEELAGKEEDIERTMSGVHRDLFEDDSEMESDNNLSDLDPSDPRSRRSAYERRQAKVAEEIRRLEAANVAKRQWQLAGEVRANDRPMNSLLEEDLDFERAGKPIPVITAEISEDIEALIKRRILAGEFDEIRRRRPDDLATGPRRGRFELDDTKSGKGLAEIYEEEHLRQNDPNFVDAHDEKLKKEHAEIEAMWKTIRGKLDSLSSWHYKPKPAAPNLEIRVDAPAIEMEDARPTAGGAVASASMLAPQELYKPGDETDKKVEIVTKSGLPVSREEMTREQRLRRRRREKAKIKKANANKPVVEKNAKETKSEAKKQLIGDLKRGGVQVIGKKGQVTDVEGKEIRELARAGAGAFKL